MSYQLGACIPNFLNNNQTLNITNIKNKTTSCFYI